MESDVAQLEVCGFDLAGNPEVIDPQFLVSRQLVQAQSVFAPGHLQIVYPIISFKRWLIISFDRIGLISLSEWRA